MKGDGFIVNNSDFGSLYQNHRSFVEVSSSQTFAPEGQGCVRSAEEMNSRFDLN